jgi:predicted dehydrogenase
MNIGVIGLGYWGPNIVRNFLSQECVDLVTCCDQDERQLIAIRKKFNNVVTTKDATDVFRDESIKAVAIVTPIKSHFALAKQALLHGKHILVEKPLTSSVAEAEELIELAQRQNLKICVDHTFLYTPAVEKIKELISTGELGKIYYFDSTRINLGLFQSDVNVIWDLVPHDFAIMNYLLERKPLALRAMGADHVGSGRENIAYVHIDFGENLIAHFHVNWLSPVKIRQTLIGGSKKMVMYDDMENSEKIKIFDKGIVVNEAEERYQQLVNYRLGDVRSPLLNNTEALNALIKDFIESIITDKSTRAMGHHGLSVVSLLEATQESLKGNGKEIYL